MRSLSVGRCVAGPRHDTSVLPCSLGSLNDRVERGQELGYVFARERGGAGQA